MSIKGKLSTAKKGLSRAFHHKATPITLNATSIALWGAVAVTSGGVAVPVICGAIIAMNGVDLVEDGLKWKRERAAKKKPSSDNNPGL